MLTQLTAHMVEKPWGRDDLAPPFVDSDAAISEPIGELWYQSPIDASDDPLLIKYLFTSEKLSVQVHPDDCAARAGGHKSGKAECWYVLDAKPDAVLGLGLKTSISPDALRQASLSGAVEQMIDWKPTKAGDVWYVPPGTIHAIGPGLTLIEVQQNIDLTYRLYDYGRPRALHLDDAIAVANAAPYAMQHHSHYDGTDMLVHEWPHFGMALCSGADGLANLSAMIGDGYYCVPINGAMHHQAAALMPGNVYHIASGQPHHSLTMEYGANLLIGWPRSGA